MSRAQIDRRRREHRISLLPRQQWPMLDHWDLKLCTLCWFICWFGFFPLFFALRCDLMASWVYVCVSNSSVETVPHRRGLICFYYTFAPKVLCTLFQSVQALRACERLQTQQFSFSPHFTISSIVSFRCIKSFDSSKQWALCAHIEILRLW